jgi:quercetin dioxygenase-like cupin family protein
MTVLPTPTASLLEKPYHLAAGEGPALWHLGALLTFKATSETTGGRCWVQEALGQRGFASPMRRHTREDEAFYLLEGEMSFYVGDDVVRAEPGSFLWGPRDVPHAFCVESAQARFLAFSTPGGADRFFFATGEPAASLTVPPPAAGPPDIDALVAALNELGVEMLGPPPAPRG